MAPLVEMLPTNFFPSVPPSIDPELVPESRLEPELEPELEEPELVEASAPELDPPPDVELPLVPEPELEPEVEEDAPPPELEPAEVLRPPSSAGCCWLPSDGPPDDPQAISASVATAGSRERKRILPCINSAVAAGARTRQRIRARHSREGSHSAPRLLGTSIGSALAPRVLLAGTASSVSNGSGRSLQCPYPAATMLA
jgi:hypothetical protein